MKISVKSANIACIIIAFSLTLVVFTSGCAQQAGTTNTTTTLEGTSSTTDCHNLYWFDNSNMICGQKEFCGMYMYQGLQTFENIADCESALATISSTTIASSSTTIEETTTTIANVSSNSTIIISVKDAAKNSEFGNITSLVVTFSEVSVHKASDGESVNQSYDDINTTESNETESSEWIVLVNTTQTVDLLQFTNSSAIIGEKPLGPGHYTQIRIAIDSATVGIDGINYALTIPSKFLKLNRGFVLGSNSALNLTLDFKAEKSIIRTGSGKFKLKPVIAVASDPCICPQSYIRNGSTCNPACYYNTPKCLSPSVKCSKNGNIPVTTTTSTSTTVLNSTNTTTTSVTTSTSTTISNSTNSTTTTITNITETTTTSTSTTIVNSTTTTYSTTTTSSTTTSTTLIPANYSVFMQNYSFNPQQVNISLGSTVFWINNDTDAHSVSPYDGSNISGFGSQNLSSGESYNFTFNQTGTFLYHCSINTSMNGTVFVQ